jgi:small ligand-binding sensory domain FIST
MKAMKCISALSTLRDSDAALRQVFDQAVQRLGGEPANLVLVFASMHHADALGELAGLARGRGLGEHVLGCTGESIVGEDQEVERGPALSLWALRLPGITVRPRQFTFADGAFEGWPELEGAARTHGGSESVPGELPQCLILLGDPFSFPTDLFLKRYHEIAPGRSVIGGMASGSQVPEGNRLVLDGSVATEGAVAVELSGPLLVRTIVSQGCRPIGRTMIVTRAEQNMIRELGRRPVIDVIREVYADLPAEDQELVRQGLHIGRVINEYQDKFQRGDFLVRNVIGGDEAGGMAVTDVIRVGQTVQFHVRDAATADEDLRSLLIHERRTRPEAGIAGALLFTCNGRGLRLFPEPNHDIAAIHELLGPVPVAGFFAMGEIGPVGGQNFVHGFTASIALFEEV